MTIFETGRLLFRTHEAADEDAFVQMHADPQVRRYVGGVAWPQGKAIDRFRMQYLGRPANTFGLWAAVLKEEERYVGACGLTGSENGAQLGYYIARPYWGRGLATEAAMAFVDFGFGKLGLSQIHASVEKGHDASEHILRKLGFNLTGEETLGSGRVICGYELKAGPADRSSDRM